MTATPCPDPGHPVGSAIYARARKRATAERIPLAGMFELTARCNLACVHCYLGGGAVGPKASAELSTADVRALIDQAVAAGCLDLVLTGGEPLLRRDFAAIYRHARESGTLVTVFTNGTLVRDEHLALFRELPPTLVEISLYGASAAVYESVTGVAGSHARCLSGIRRLAGSGVRVALKTVILERNQHEVGAMEAFARSLGLPFRMDPVIGPRLDGNPSPLAERAEPTTAARLEFLDPKKREDVRVFIDRQRRQPRHPTVYQCSAGVNMFYVTPTGGLRPCLMTTDMEFATVDAGFDGAWRAATRAIGAPTWQPGDRCRNCDDLPICGFCPALLRLEKGTATASSDYLCRLGSARRTAIAATADELKTSEDCNVN